MINEIVRLAFQQAAEETPNVTKTGLSKHISRKIEDNDSRKIFSYKTFTRYYDKYVLGKDGVIDHPQAEIIEELCKYLGYENYQAFVTLHKGKHKKVVLVNDENNFQNTGIQNVVTAGFGAGKANELKDSFFLNKNLIKQLVLTVVLILCFKINWTTGEKCVFCLDENDMKFKTHSAIYNEVMYENTKKTLDTTFIFYKTENLCYGADRQRYNF